MTVLYLVFTDSLELRRLAYRTHSAPGRGPMLAVWRVFHIPELLPLWSKYDPGALWFAERVSALLFNRRGIAPSPAEATLFAPLLVVGFGIECFVGGVLIRMVVRWIQGRKANGVITGSPTTGLNRPS